MSSWLEYDGLLATNNGRAIQCHKKVVDRRPMPFSPGILDRPGRGHWLSLFGEGEEANGNAKTYDSLLRHNPLTGAITFAGLDPNAEVPGGILWPCTDPSQLQFESSRFVKGTTRGLNILSSETATILTPAGVFPLPRARSAFPCLPPAVRPVWKPVACGIYP